MANLRKYILLKDVIGIEKKRFLGKNTSVSPYNALTGGLFYKSAQQDEAIEELCFISANPDNPDKSIVTIEENLRPLNNYQFEILSAIPSCFERTKFLTNDLYDKILEIKKGDFVHIQLHVNQGVKAVSGEVQYIGPIDKKKGYYFGILLSVCIIILLFKN